jgi:hypothetical protein
MKQIDFVQLVDGKSIYDAIDILKRIGKRHPDAKLVAQYEEDATFLNVEWPRVRKHRARPSSAKPRKPLTPIEKMQIDWEKTILFGPGLTSSGIHGLAWWINNAGRM